VGCAVELTPIPGMWGAVVGKVGLKDMSDTGTRASTFLKPLQPASRRGFGLLEPEKMDTGAPSQRWAAIARDTNETSIQLALNLDGGNLPPNTDSRLIKKDQEGHASQASKSQTISISTGIGFLDHMLHALSKHAGWSLLLACKGDLHSKPSDG
jgi:hypothetical protein